MNATGSAQRPDSFFHSSVDLFFGAGLGYLVTLPLVAWVGFRTGTTQWPLAVVLALSLLISVPHYGATLLRVYEHSADRRKYALFSIHLSLAILALFVLGLHVHWIGSLIVTLYFTWSPWHFGAQNYGISLLFLRRRGVEVTPEAKRWLYLSFAACYVVAVLALNVDRSTRVFAVGLQEPQDTFSLLRLGIPSAVAFPMLVVSGIGYVFATFMAVRLLLRNGSLRELFPSVLLITSQALWFAYPAVIQIMGLHDFNSLVFGAIWVSTAHSLQYLWITSYYATRTEHPTAVAPFLAKSLAMGGAIAIVPGLIFAPEVFGTIHWNNGLALLLFSALNVHHFMLDGAVWKLRDGRIARVLLQLDGPDASELDDSRGRWLTYGIMAAGGLAFLVPAVSAYHLFYAMPRAGNELAAVQRSASVLHSVGRDHPAVLARLGFLYQDRSQPDRAIEAYRNALTLSEDPTSALARHNLARLLAIHGPYTPDAREEAIALASRVVEEIGGQEPSSLDTLAAAYANAGRYDEATETAKRAAELATAQGSHDLAREIRRNQATYQSGKPLRE